MSRDDVWYVIDGTHAIRMWTKNNPLSLVAFPRLPELQRLLQREGNAVELKPTPAYIEEEKRRNGRTKKTALHKFLAGDTD